MYPLNGQLGKFRRMTQQFVAYSSKQQSVYWTLYFWLAAPYLWILRPIVLVVRSVDCISLSARHVSRNKAHSPISTKKSISSQDLQNCNFPSHEYLTLSYFQVYKIQCSCLIHEIVSSYIHEFLCSVVRWNSSIIWVALHIWFLGIFTFL